MCLKCRKKITNPLAQVSLIDDDFGIGFVLFLFATNIKKEFRGVLEWYFFLLEFFFKKQNS